MILADTPHPMTPRTTGVKPIAHCLRCKKPLYNPVSAARQYGPICWSKVQNQRTLVDESEEDAT
jgi:hypothetical protein